MNRGRRCLAAWVACLALLCAAGSAQAGRSCEQKPLTAEVLRKAMNLAQHTAEALDRTGAQVVVIGRMGQNLGEYHVQYSHLGFAYRTDGGWRVVHKLNECGTATAAIYRQGLGDFFLDDLYRYQAAFLIPTPEVQARLLPAMSSNERLGQLNTPTYSMVAYPWSQKYQQSNQWAIETLAMTQEPAAFDRVHAQAWLQLKGYQPATLNISAFKRLGAEVSRANIAFDDHPLAKRFSDRIETVTADSVFTWLNLSGLGGDLQVIR